jgi:hypothetical protein
MRAVLRGLRARFWALSAVAVTVSVAAGFAALNATAWVSGLPQGARSDLLASSSDGVLISNPVQSAAEDAAVTATVRAATARTMPAGSFDLESVSESDVFNLPSGQVDGALQQTYAVSSTAVRQDAALTTGSWPTPATTGVIGAALPVSTLQDLGLHVGGTLTVQDSTTHTAISFLITGAYQYSAEDAGALVWNQIGPTGVEPVGPWIYFGPLVVDPADFSSGTVPTAGGSWVLTPSGSDLDLTALAAQATALAHSPDLAPSDGFTVSTTLPALVTSLSARISAARAQLLAAGILLGMLAGIALAASAGNLVSRGAVQAALLRSRGAPRRTLVSGYLADIAVIFVFAAGGAVAQEPLPGNGLGDRLGNAPGSGVPLAAWVAALAVALAAGLIICARAARPAEAAVVAAAAGRQGAIPGVIRAGTDVALIALAGVAVWQAGEVGLSAHGTGGGSSVVLIVAAAPALSVAAGAALCGRLVTGAARLSERAARRTRNLPTRLAAWELARTPLRYLVPALLCVAAVAGCGYSAAQHASWLRSAHDQAGFSTGADVAVNLRQVLPLGQVGTVSAAHGVLAATPVAQVDLGDGTLLAVDSKTAAAAVSLRPDLAGQPVADLWSKLTPAQVAPATTSGSAGPTAPAVTTGLAVPGRPTALGVTAALTGTGQVPMSVQLTVQDASGLTYSVSMGSLPADDAQHSLSAQIAAAGEADYPLRVIGVTLESTDASDQPSAYVLTVSGLTEETFGSNAFVAFAAAGTLSTWSSAVQWSETEQNCELSSDPVAPVIHTTKSPSGGMFVSWFGAQDCSDTPAPTALALTPPGTSTLVVPAIATRSYLAANDLHVGSASQVTVNGLDVSVRIVASVAAFPTPAPQTPNLLVVDLAVLNDAVNGGGAQLWPTYTWWLRTVDGLAPPGLPTSALASTSADAQASLVSDPLSAIPQRVLTVGAPVLVLLAVLGLLISLLAAARDSSARDMVLSALGTTRPQRAVLACLLHSSVVLPAALLGAGLGLLLARLLTPVFVLAPDASPPQPPAVVLFDAPWSVAAVAVILVATVTAALAASLGRADPLALSRAGG